MNQTDKYSANTALKVNGTEIFINSLFLTLCPFSLNIPKETIFAEAPIGVKLPPKVAPIKSPKKSTVEFIDVIFESFCITGSIVATYVILSINAEIKAELQTTTVYIKNLFEPSFVNKREICSISPASVIPPIIINREISNNRVL